MKYKNFVTEFLNEVWNHKNGDQNIYDSFDNNVIVSSPLGKVVGKNSLKNIYEKWLKGFPDIKVTVLNNAVDNNKIISTWKCEGTHLNYFNGLEQTNKKIEYTGVTSFELHDNKITRYNCYLNMVDIYDQLGAVLEVEKYKNQHILKFNYELLINELKAFYFEYLLSRKEIECICLIVCGYSAKEIAIIFNISPRTVENHIFNIMVKLNINHKHNLRNLIFENKSIHLFRDLSDLIIKAKAKHCNVD